MSDVNAMIKRMESSIEFITNNITESEIIYTEGPTCKPTAQDKLWKALYHLESTLKALGESPNESTNRKNFNYKGRVKEIRYMITELGKAWDDIGN